MDRKRIGVHRRDRRDVRHGWRQPGQGVKVVTVGDKRGALLDCESPPANPDDHMDVMPMLPRQAAVAFEGNLFGGADFQGSPLAAAAPEHDIHVPASPAGARDGRLLPKGIG